MTKKFIYTKKIATNSLQKKLRYIFIMLSDIFLKSFLDFLISLNSLFSSPKLFHISFSFTLDSFCFIFIFSAVYFCWPPLFVFVFVFPFLCLFLHNLVKTINIYWFLLIEVSFITYCFVVLWVFLQEILQLFFVLVRFEGNRFQEKRWNART